VTAPAIAKRQGAGRPFPDVQPGAAWMEAILRAFLWIGHGPCLAAHGRLLGALADAEARRKTRAVLALGRMAVASPRAFVHWEAGFAPAAG
jgi:hypothetical protein